MDNKIIFATSNEGKMKEIKMIMADLNMEILSLKEAGININIIEDGKTFEENAIIKVKAIRELTDNIILADDSGLEVDYLDKQPGVYSARYMGENTPYEKKNKAIITLLEGVEENARAARFVCCIAASFPDGEIITTRGTIEGQIARQSAGDNGFGYDPIMYIPELKLTIAQLDCETKNQISHRGKALRKMKEIISKKK